MDSYGGPSASDWSKIRNRYDVIVARPYWVEGTSGTDDTRGIDLMVAWLDRV